MSISVDYSLYARLLRLLGDDVVMLLPFWDGSLAADDEVVDISPMSYHFRMGAAAFDADPMLRGTTFAYDFNGTDEYLIRADTADFSFDGTTDHAFSVGAWCNMQDITSSVILAKYDSNTPLREWLFQFDGADKLNLELWDETANGSEGRITAALTTLQNEWIFCVGTYDGVGGDGAGGVVAAAGIELYVYDLAGTILYDVGNDNAGNYADMDDLAEEIYVGASMAAALENFYDGQMALPFVTPHELSATTIQRIWEVGREILAL